MPSFTITSVDPDPRPWNTKKGNPWLSYKVEYTGDQGASIAGEPSELSRPADAPAPKPGEVIDAEIDNSNPAFPPKLREARKNGGGGGGGFRGKSPEERTEMRRMSAQKQAIALLDVELKSGLIPAEKLAAVKASELLKPRIDFFDDDAKAAG